MSWTLLLSWYFDLEYYNYVVVYFIISVNVVCVQVLISAYLLRCVYENAITVSFCTNYFFCTEVVVYCLSSPKLSWQWGFLSMLLLCITICDIRWIWFRHVESLKDLQVNALIYKGKYVSDVQNQNCLKYQRQKIHSLSNHADNRDTYIYK